MPIVVELHFGTDAQTTASKDRDYTKLIRTLNSLPGVVSDFANAGAGNDGVVTLAIVRDLSQRCQRENRLTRHSSQLRLAIDSALKDARIETVLWHEAPEKTASPNPGSAEMQLTHKSITPIRWSGPRGTVLSINGVRLNIGSAPTCFGIGFGTGEVRQVDLSLEYPPLLRDANLCVRLFVYPLDAATARILQDAPVPLVITKEDLEAVLDDDFVKVFYLPHPQPGNESPTPVEIVDSTHGEPDGDKFALEKARKSGKILAVLRLGKDFKTLGRSAADQDGAKHRGGGVAAETLLLAADSRITDSR